MENILVIPKNQEELSFVKDLLRKIRVKNTVLLDEDLEDIKLFDKAMKRITSGNAEFMSLAAVKQKFGNKNEL